MDGQQAQHAKALLLRNSTALLRPKAACTWRIGARHAQHGAA